jgi:hypothetical protein
MRNTENWRAREVPMTVPVEKRVGRNIARRAGGVSMRFFLPGKVTRDTPGRTTRA